VRWMSEICLFLQERRVTEDLSFLFSDETRIGSSFLMLCGLDLVCCGNLFRTEIENTFCLSFQHQWFSSNVLLRCRFWRADGTVVIFRDPLFFAQHSELLLSF
jgi:hypothetical protein